MESEAPPTRTLMHLPVFPAFLLTERSDLDLLKAPHSRRSKTPRQPRRALGLGAMVECLRQNSDRENKGVVGRSAMNMDQNEAHELLLSSSREGDAERAEALLQRWPQLDINARDRRTGNTALMWAAARGHAKVLQVRALTFSGDFSLSTRCTR